VSPPLKVYEREPVIAEYGLHALLDPELAFVFLHTTRKIKKVGNAHFFETLARV